MDYGKEALEMHEKFHGKIEVCSKVPLKTRKDLSTAYTPGVASPCMEIYKEEEKAYCYTAKGTLVAVVTDGTAVLGLGDIGPKAAMPVMEGKAVLLKEFGGVDAFPICLDTKDTEEIIETKIEDIKVVLNGPGSAGTAIARMMLHAGVKHMTICDLDGILAEGCPFAVGHKLELARLTNPERITGTLRDAIKGADVFVGVSAGNILTKEMVSTMAAEPVVFAMANPTPEITYEDAVEAGVKVMGTGRSDYPNQINNVLAFPGLFRGALDAGARDITYDMKLAAARAIASLVTEEELKPDYIIPSPFDKRVAVKVAEEVAKCAHVSVF